MDDEEETYRLWKIRKTIMQVSGVGRFERALSCGLTAVIRGLASNRDQPCLSLSGAGVHPRLKCGVHPRWPQLLGILLLQPPDPASEEKPWVGSALEAGGRTYAWSHLVFWVLGSRPTHMLAHNYL